MSTHGALESLGRRNRALQEFLDDPSAARDSIADLIVKTELLEQTRIRSLEAVELAAKEKAEAAVIVEQAKSAQEQLDATKKAVDERHADVEAKLKAVRERENALLRADESMKSEFGRKQAELQEREIDVSKREASVHSLESAANAKKADFERRIEAIRKAVAE